MPSTEYDLVYLEAGIDQLKEFLLVYDLFWPIGVKPPSGEPTFPRLTLGGLLLSRERLRARRLPLYEEAQITKLVSRMDEIKTSWRIAWENKVARAFNMRLNMWRDFMEEYRKEPELNADRYSYEVRLRVMLHLLNLEIEVINPTLLDLLSMLDNFLSTVLVSKDFIWDAEIMGGFSRDEYWYLYGSLPEELYNSK